MVKADSLDLLMLANELANFNELVSELMEDNMVNNKSLRLGCIIDTDGTLLWFPSQERTVLVRKPYVFGSETVRFWDGERKKE
mgnify:CR=1 FL=1